MKCKLSCLTAVLSMFLLFNTIIPAQSFLMRQKSGSWVAAEFNFLNMSSKIFSDVSGWNAHINLKLKLNDDVYLLSEIPFVHGSTDNIYWYNKSETTIANPYLGMQFKTKTPGLSFETGIRIPLLDEKKSTAYEPSILSDLERFSTVFPNTAGFDLLSCYEFDIDNGFYGNISLGPSLWIPTKKDGRKNELLADYQFGFGYKNEVVNFSTRLIGLMLLSESNLDFDQRTYHQIVVCCAVEFNNIEPGVIFRFPLDEFSLHKYIIGLNIGVRFGE